MRALLIALLPLAALTIAAGCSSVSNPVASRTFSTEWTSQEPTRSQSDGTLFFTDHGLWGFESSTSDFLPQYPPGSLLRWAGQRPHYFVVIKQTRKGYWLQRLDNREISTQAQGHLRPVHLDNPENLDNPDFCLIPAGTSARDAACTDLPGFQRWRVYSLAAEPSFPDRRIAALPIQPSALLTRQGPAFTVEGLDVATQDRIALRTHLASPPLVHARIVAEPSCPDSLTRPSSSQRLHWRTATSSFALPATHPLEVEALARRHGADLLIRCATDKVELLIPMLSRGAFRNEHHYTALPSLGLSPRDLTELNGETRQSLIASAAFTAIGDYQAAIFALEDLLTARIESEPLKDFLLASMTTFAATGYSEQALRLGRVLTAGNWNPEHNLDFLDGMILLHKAFNDRTREQEHVGDRQNLVRQHKNTHRLGFYQFSHLRLELYARQQVHGPAYDSLIASLEEADEEAWALAAFALLAMERADLPRVDDPALLTPRFADLGVADYWLALHDELDSPPTFDAPSGIHGYRFQPATASSGPELIDELLFRPVLSFRQGYRLEDIYSHLSTLEGVDRPAFLLAIAPLAARQHQPELMATFLGEFRDVYRRAPDAFCSQPQYWKNLFSVAHAKLDAPVLPARQREWLLMHAWTADTGLPALCEGPEAFLGALGDVASTSLPWTGLFLPLLGDQVLQISSGPRFIDLIGSAAALSRQMNDAQTCTHWNLGVSIGLASSGNLDDAETHLIHATNCPGNDPQLRRTRNLVEAYLEFERGAGRSIARDGGIERLVSAATRKAIEDEETCLGVLPIGFQIEAFLPSTVVRISERIRSASRSQHHELLQTASAIISDAQASYLSGLRDLQRGRLSTAAFALASAQRDFQRLGHLPGIARLAFLDQVLFDGSLLSLANETDEDDINFTGIHSPLLSIIQDRKLQPPANAPGAEPVTEELAVRYLIFGQDAELRDMASQGLLSLPNLCTPPQKEYYLQSDEEYDESSLEIIRSGPRD